MLMSPEKRFMIGLMAFCVGLMLYTSLFHWFDDSTHKDYQAVAAMQFSELQVGQTVDLQKYNVSLKSGNKSILQVGTSDSWFSGSKLVLTAAAKGDTVLIISDKSSDAYKVIKVHIE